MNTTCELDTRTAELNAELERMNSLEHNFWLAATIVKNDADLTLVVELAKLILESQRRILDLLDELIDDGKISNMKATRIMQELDKKVHAICNTVFS